MRVDLEHDTPIATRRDQQAQNAQNAHPQNADPQKANLEPGAHSIPGTRPKSNIDPKSHIDPASDERPEQDAHPTSAARPERDADKVFGGPSGQKTGPEREPKRAARLRHFLSNLIFFSLTRRIVVLNIAALAALMAGILYLNQFRAGLIDARVESLMTQGEIIAGAIAASASLDTDGITLDPEQLLQDRVGDEPGWGGPEPDFALEFPINPERVGPVLRRLISPTQTRARIYDRDGFLLLDSRNFYVRGQSANRLGAGATAELAPMAWVIDFVDTWLSRRDLPNYVETGTANGRGYPEVSNALGGASASIVRVDEQGDLIVFVAVPIRRQGTPAGALLLSTEGGDISAIVRAERLAIVRSFLVAASVTAVLSVLLAGTIAGPIRRLSAAANRVRQSVKARQEIPEFAGREDEIGHLARAFADMTNALYDRIAAIETFAADVSHELKNPLTSLRSAVETLPLATSDEQRTRLTDVIQHDVRRLDRLITDISDASRLDAELVRADADIVDVKLLVASVLDIARGLKDPKAVSIIGEISPAPDSAYQVYGHPSRLGQVLNNLIDNARSFSPMAGKIRVSLSRQDALVLLTVDDEGPGISEDVRERIFDRFYTDRPAEESFGNHSGLGLSISRQIIEAHGGHLTAHNRHPKAGAGSDATGASFTITLPAFAGPAPGKTRRTSA